MHRSPLVPRAALDVVMTWTHLQCRMSASVRDRTCSSWCSQLSRTRSKRAGPRTRSMASSADSVPGGNAVELGEHEFCRAPIARDHRQIDEANPVLERLPHRTCNSYGQTRLPHPPGTNEGDQAGRSHLVDEISDQLVPPDEPRQLGRHVAVFSLDEPEGGKLAGQTVRLATRTPARAVPIPSASGSPDSAAWLPCGRPSRTRSAVTRDTTV